MSYLSKVDLTYLTSVLAPPLGMTSFVFRRNIRRQKTTVPEIYCGVVCVILRLAVSVEHRLVTDRHRTTAYRADRARIASRGKNTPALACCSFHIHQPINFDNNIFGSWYVQIFIYCWQIWAYCLLQSIFWRSEQHL